MSRRAASTPRRLNFLLSPRCFLGFLAEAALTVLLLLPGGAHAEALPITLDGLFVDWTGGVEMTDPSGDAGGSGIDFLEFDFANDDDWLFLRFETTVEVGLQESNNIVLYLDTDMNAATGLSISGIGAELSWRFGDRQGTWHPTSSSVFQSDISFRQLPTVTGNVFEVSIARSAQPNGSDDLFTGNSFRALLVDTGGDQVPNSGMTVTYTFDATPVPGPTPTVLTREMAGDLRVVTWNVRDLEGGALWSSTATAAADRIFSALTPNIICFQEIYAATASETAALVESFLPSGPGESWEARESNDNKIVSRYPIVDSWALDGNLAVHLNTTSVWNAEMIVISAHLPCCSNNAGRQEEIDHIMSFLRDAMTVGGLVDVAPGTVFLITGDLNLVGDAQQLTTLLTGDIIDNGTYGPDFAPDWDGSDLADVRPIQSEARFAYTWRNDGSSFNPGRLDFIIYNDSTVDLGRNFVIYTPEMSATELSTYGMLADDVIDVSDHLPVVADFRQIVPSDAGERSGDRRSGARIEAVQPGLGVVRFALSLPEPANANIEIFDVRGQRIAQLRQSSEGPLSAGTHRFEWDGDQGDGRPAASGVYLLRVLTRSVSGASSSQQTTKLHLLR